MSLVLVRHGRTVANASGELLGRRDPALDDVGRVQADRVAAVLAARFAGTPPSVVTSPLARAAATAEAIADRFGVQAEVDGRWIELDYGELDGVRLVDVPSDTWSAWRADPTFAPPGGETLAAVRARVDAALAELLDRERRGEHVIVVSHVSPIKAAVASALGVGDEITWRLFLSPGSITELGSRPGGAALVGFNNVAHLLDP